jgi:hypothetical protein
MVPMVHLTHIRRRQACAGRLPAHASRSGRYPPPVGCYLRYTIFWTLAMPLHSVTSQGTRVEVIPDRVECQRCAITVRTLASLGDSIGPGSIGSAINAVNVDAQGRYWVLEHQQLPMVFDRAGRFIAAPGRRGDGPGELGDSQMYVVPIAGDSILVLGTGRATVFAGDLQPIRTVRLPSAFIPVIIFRWPDLVLANGYVGSPDASGWPLHRLSFAAGDAQILASFGPDDGTLRPGQFSFQRLAPSGSNAFWSADWDGRYRLIRWTFPQEQALTLERRPSWFPRSSGSGYGSPQRPPPPRIAGILEDSTGLVWVFANTAAPTWRRAWPKDNGAGEVEVGRLAHEKLFQTVVEIIDPRSKRVVARQTIPKYVLAALAGRRAAAYTVDRADIPHIEILLFDLTRR